MNVLVRINAADPQDVRVKNDLANLYLLRKAELERAFRLAREAYTSVPTDPYFSSTYAYSLLLQKRPGEALRVMADLNPKYLQIPSIAAYYGIVQAASGNKDLAKEPLRFAEHAILLPEEKELVHLATARL
jgi:Flp pilus assembly protein TadD